MSTVALQIWTSAYPSITNDITVRVYEQSDPLAIVAAITRPAPHPADSWSFPGLDRTNLLFRIFETNAGVIVQQLGADMNVIPGSAGGVEFKATEQITADVTPGIVGGATSFTFDGTGGSPDWRGWDIDTIDRVGQGPMKKNEAYSWVPGTGVFQLLTPGDVFAAGEWFNVEFAANKTNGTDSVSTRIIRANPIKIITADYPIDAGADMSGLLILRPAGNYMELQLPDIDTVVAGRFLDIEMDCSVAMKCAKFKVFGAQNIAFQNGRPDLYICPGESFSIFKFVDPAGPTSMWRIYKPFGNFLTVGDQVFNDALPANVFNKHLFDGSALDVFQYARLYNDYVKNLPNEQLVNFDDWPTGNNKYKWSRANGSGIDLNKFRIPNRLGEFIRNTDGARVPGDYQAGAVGAHTHPGIDNIETGGHSAASSTLGGRIRFLVNTFASGGNNNATSISQIRSNGGGENRPSNVASRKYLLV